MHRLANLIFLAAVTSLAWPNASHAIGGTNSLFVQFGAIYPYDYDTPYGNGYESFDTAPQFTFGFLYRSSYRWAFAGKMEYIGWDDVPPAPIPGVFVYSDVWRSTANMMFDLMPGHFTPFVTFDAGVARYEFQDWGYLYGSPGTYYREGIAFTPTFGAGLGFAADSGPIRASVTGQWVTFMDDLPNAFSVAGGLEFKLTPPHPPKKKGAKAPKH
jgi:hypothetical protein